ncbi:25029_t:CDS:2 [Gigaspora margarita]|uniref:25029_t:CDS:1 n=1 Tax=Gigaspora margarita TaxID=4874 RepID=A0ABN7UCV4_GIGMA|nr:25029_t:CDS:2 [Gigaspora margarita]
MSEIKKCMECKTTKSQQFRSLAGKKWEEAEAAGLIKEAWVKGNKLCNKCYMNFVENLLKKAKRVKVSIEDKIKESVELRDVETTMREDIEAVDEEVSMINLVEVVRSMARIFYKREHTWKEGPIYLFDEMRELLLQIDPSLKNFFDQLYLLARPFERCEQTMGHMKRLMVFLCYLLASLNHSKINSFKFDLAYYLDSVGTSNEHLDERFMANLGVSYHDRVKGKGSNNDLIEKLTLHSYNDRLAEKKSDRHIQNAILFDFVKGNLKSVENYTKALQIFSETEQLQKEARFIFQHREDNAFRKYFVDSVKYPYTPKQLHMLSQKCTVLLLGLFKKIYQACYQYSSIIDSSNNINTYKLYSLGYEITDRHLPRGFVTSRKPFTTALCDYLNCNCIDYSDCSKVLACGHGYHNQCLEKCQFKCLICLDYLKQEIKKNVDALKVSLVKKLGDNEFIDERRENIVEDNVDNVEIATGDTTIEELEFAKKLFLEL